MGLAPRLWCDVSIQSCLKILFLKEVRLMLHISNAFSLGMLQGSEVTLKVTEVNLATVKSLLKAQDFQSAVGHQGTADIVTSLLDVAVPMNRISLKLGKGDTLVVFQLLTRLEEGRVLSKEEVEKLPFKFFLVEVL